LPASPHRDNGSTWRRRSPPRCAAPECPSADKNHTSRTPTPDRVDSPARPGAPHDLLDDPLTLIAMANALYADRPARTTAAPVTGFDWTAQLSHRRLTCVPDTLPR